MTEQGMSRSLGSRNHSVGVAVGLIWSCLLLKVMVSLHPKPKVYRTKLKALAWVRGNMPTLPGWRKEEEEKEEEEGECMSSGSRNNKSYDITTLFCGAEHCFYLQRMKQELSSWWWTTAGLLWGGIYMGLEGGSIQTKWLLGYLGPQNFLPLSHTRVFFGWRCQCSSKCSKNMSQSSPVPILAQYPWTRKNFHELVHVFVFYLFSEFSRVSGAHRFMNPKEWLPWEVVNVDYYLDWIEKHLWD